ncbi:MAG: hypothetical protein JXA21_04750 [Anaerolineae bacterium]|nr:hypothetical protein [Anaerolineae bacterium]
MSKRWVILLVGFGLILSVATALAQGTLSEVPRWVMGNGGGRATGADVVLNDTLGQTFAGWSDGGAIDLHAGYWTGLSAPKFRLYLPLVLLKPRE